MSPLAFGAEAKETFAFCISDELVKAFTENYTLYSSTQGNVKEKKIAKENLLVCNKPQSDVRILAR